MKKRIIKIVMPRLGDGLRIAKVFNCSAQAVSYALNMRTHSELSKKIRQYALNNGGQEIKG